MKMSGAVMKNGMRIKAAKIGTVSSTSTTATMLPTYIDAIRRLWRDDPFCLTPTKAGFASRKALGYAIAHERSSRRPARRDPHPAADCRAAQQCPAIARKPEERAKNFPPV